MELRLTTYLLIFLLITGQNLFGQNQASIFYFGTAGIDFRTDPPTALINSRMNGLESPASICDSAGNLLFYTNGGNNPGSPGTSENGAIWTRNHEVMENGYLLDTAGCNSSFQGAIIIPVPGDVNRYYVFTKDCVENIFIAPKENRGLRYTMVDISLNGGLGKVIEKGVPVVAYDLISSAPISSDNEPVSGILHDNNRDYWIFSYKMDSIYSLLVDSTGIHSYITHDIGNGRIVISPKRDFIVFGKALYRLNCSNGKIFNKLELNASSVEFSPNGNYLYTIKNQKLMQYDLLANNLLSSEILIGNDVSSQLSLAPNGKIYNWDYKSNRLKSVIACPNEPELNCAYQNTSFDLNGKSIERELTNVLPNFLYRDSIVCSEPPTRFLGEKDPECLINIYPNSGIDAVNITFSDDSIGACSLVIYNILGQCQEQFYNIQEETVTLQTKTWPSGLYILRLFKNNIEHCRKKLIVVK